ncbi:MAG: penicillin-binding protein 2 [Methylovulum sp.]|jgi:cell division protein FtsI (penicillin-binding protein 3)|nr:penicillin-binding protein 2 [Methylovulum sp.]MCF7997906.1 penicillin-binding protein 2 [Methylovulum sp.]
MHDFRLKTKPSKPVRDFSNRKSVLLAFMMACMVLLTGRATYLQIFEKDFLQDQGDDRQVDEVVIPAYRGMIKDRNGAPLAVSTPVESIAINPRELISDDKNRLKKMEKEFKLKQNLEKLSETDKAQVLNEYRREKAQKIRRVEKILQLPDEKISSLLNEDPLRAFVYVARRIDPGLTEQIKELKLAGVYFEREFKRYYPIGSVSAHLVGFTDVDEVGQGGLELSYEKVLRGLPGSKRVIRDGQRQIIADVENINNPINGKNLELSIDQRIQYLAYKELQLAVEANGAKSGTLVILDAKNGEVLALANQPSFNPNTRKNLKEYFYRNRALTEVFEPGSTVKPFVVAAALDGGYIKLNDLFETNGSYQIGHHTVKDVHNYGTLDLTHVLQKSSNIAVSQMALKMPPKYFWTIYHQLGFGVSAGTGFPGEATGSLLDYQRWHEFERATMSFGYGLNASALQLAKSYTALADDGILHSVSLLKRDEDIDEKRVFSAKTARRIREMMEHVVAKDGTAYEARVDGFSVAGKTGTVKKSGGKEGYVDKKYFSVFAGIAPAKKPRLIMVVMIDEPSAGQYYGGLVSAPVFSKVMTGALRILDVPPDQEETMPVLLTQTH